MNTIEVSKDKYNRTDFARLRSVLACTSKDASRHVINKVLVEAAEEGITVIATDGKRLRTDRFSLEAEPGIYDIKINSAKTVFLSQCEEELVFPNHRQMVPASDAEHAYELHGTGKRFAMWATSALGCYLDPDLIELGEDEEVTLHIRKDAPGMSPALFRNDTTTLVVMPIRVDRERAQEVEDIRNDIARKIIEQEEMQQQAIAT
jgi:hypothetical protein